MIIVQKWLGKIVFGIYVKIHWNGNTDGASSDSLNTRWVNLSNIWRNISGQIIKKKKIHNKCVKQIPE